MLRKCRTSTVSRAPSRLTQLALRRKAAVLGLELCDGPSDALGRLLALCNVPGHQRVVTLLRQRPPEELLRGHKAVDLESGNGVPALDDDPNRTVLPTRPRSADRLPNVRSPAP